MLSGKVETGAFLTASTNMYDHSYFIAVIYVKSFLGITLISPFTNIHMCSDLSYNNFTWSPMCKERKYVFSVVNYRLSSA